MRAPIVTLLVFASLICLVFAWTISRTTPNIDAQTLIPYFVPEVPDQFNRSITWPTKHTEPGEPNFQTDDGAETYRSWHQSAWLECLGLFYHDTRYDNKPIWRTTESTWITVGGPDHWNAARLDGYEACQSQLHTLLDAIPEAELRDRLKRNLNQASKPGVLQFAVAGVILAILAGGTALFPRRRRAEPRDAPESSS
tara:strand:- start:93 stop:683 length:591 start_codon:yes stop_codon:yes gene_type:complete